MVKRKIKLIVCLLSFTVFIFAVGNDPVVTIVSALEKFRIDYRQEKVHLHFDKPFYSVGDTIYFKAYLVSAENNQPSSLSNILYVDLINEKNAIKREIALPVESGVTWGDFVLTDTLEEGAYTIRAYTNWMRNFDESFFFSQSIRIGNALTHDIMANASFSFDESTPDAPYQADISFFQLDGKPVSGRKVDYVLKNNDKDFEKGKGMTDDKGNLRIEIPSKVEGARADVLVNIKLDDKRSVLKSFPFQRQVSQIHFFPEGGQLVNGLTSSVGFKATGPDGRGVNVSGYITDRNNKQVVTFKSGFAGIGSFMFTPAEGNEYTAVARFSDQLQKRIPLPKAVEEGYVLSLDNSNPDKLDIKISFRQPTKTADVILVAQSNNTIHYLAKSTLSDKGLEASISKKRFPTGLVQFTLFDGSNQPVAERMVFIENHDQLSIDVQPQKPAYLKKEKVAVTITVKDAAGKPVPGNFSVAVTDHQSVEREEHSGQTIFTNLLLTSDLTGYIEQPAYYFSGNEKEKIKALDDLLLTHGWRRFLWKDILQQKYPTIAFQPELSLTISGQVLNNKDQPVPSAKVTLISKKGDGFILDTLTDAAGRFHFDRLYFRDSAKYSVKAETSTGSNKLKIKMDKVPALPAKQDMPGIHAAYFSGSSMISYLKYRNKQFDDLRTHGLMKKATLLKEVVVRANRSSKIQEAIKDSWNLNGPGNADQVITYQDLRNCHNTAMCLQGKLTGVYFRDQLDPMSGQRITVPYSTRGLSSGNQIQPMLVVLDGVVMNPAQGGMSLNNLPPDNIQSIEVLRSGGFLAVYGPRGSSGVIVVTTKRGGINYDEGLYDPNDYDGLKGVVFNSSKGYYMAREFYAPDYSVIKPNTFPDLRSTIYWKPFVQTDAEGKATIEFYHSDAAGRFDVIVEGLSEKGNLGRKTAYYESR